MDRRGSYGIDAPYVLFGLFAGGIVPFAAGFFFRYGWIISVIGLFNAFSALLFAHTTLRGKFAVWQHELAGAGLSGTEKIADLGCGRGAVLTLAAEMVPHGHVTGVDLWRSVDQSGNDPAATMANAEAEGVADRITLDTADLRALPYADGQFDVVLSSLAIHNIPSKEGRAEAISEAARILKSGGRLLIADISYTDSYASELRSLGFTLTQRPLGWRFWYGGPWIAAVMVDAAKP